MGLGRGWTCIGIQLNYRLGPDYKDRLSGAAWARIVGPVRAEWDWVWIGIQDRLTGAEQGQLSGVGEGLGMHWDSIK